VNRFLLCDKDERMEIVDIARPSTWVPFKPSLCEGCFAGCCTLPVEVNAADLLRMGLANEDETRGSLKKLARRLASEGRIVSFRARSGLFILTQKPNGDCVYLDANRKCQIYAKRPDTCRNFPTIGPRSGYCPKQDFSTKRYRE